MSKKSKEKLQCCRFLYGKKKEEILAFALTKQKEEEFEYEIRESDRLNVCDLDTFAIQNKTHIIVYHFKKQEKRIFFGKKNIENYSST